MSDISTSTSGPKVSRTQLGSITSVTSSLVELLNRTMCLLKCFCYLRVSIVSLRPATPHLNFHVRRYAVITRSNILKSRTTFLQTKLIVLWNCDLYCRAQLE